MPSGSHTDRVQKKGSVSLEQGILKAKDIYLFIYLLREKKVMQYNKHAWIYDRC